MKTFIKLILIISLATQTAGAGEKEDQIQKQAERTAREEAIKSFTKRAIDKIVLSPEAYNSIYNAAANQAANAGATAGTAAANTASNSAASVGAVVVAVYNVGKSAKDFHKAENDQQRFFAAANAAVAIVSVACPPVGAIMAVALLGQGLIEGGYAKRLAEIEQRTLEYRQKSLEMQNLILNSQWEDYAFTFSTAVRAAQESQANVELMSKECKEIGASQQVEAIEKCLNYAALATSQMQISLNMSKRLLHLPANDFKFFDFLVQAGMTTSEYLRHIDILEKRVEEMREMTQELQAQYSQFVAQVYVEMAKAEGYEHMRNYYGWACESLAQNIAQQSLIFRLKLPRAKMNKSQMISALGGLQLLIEDFEAESCESQVENQSELNPFDVIRSEAKILQTMKTKLEKL